MGGNPHVLITNEITNGGKDDIQDVLVYLSMMSYVMVYHEQMRYSRNEIFSISMSQQ